MKKFLIFVLFIVMGIMNTTYARAEIEILMKGEKDGVIASFRRTSHPDYPYWIYIENKGNFPIRFNSFADEYYQITSSGEYHLMEVDTPEVADGWSWDSKVLNPRGWLGMACLSYLKPSSSIKKMMVIINYGKLKIELMPVD